MYSSLFGMRATAGCCWLLLLAGAFMRCSQWRSCHLQANPSAHFPKLQELPITVAACKGSSPLMWVLLLRHRWFLSTGAATAVAATSAVATGVAAANTSTGVPVASSTAVANTTTTYSTAPVCVPALPAGAEA